ncbi:hypothetical protein [Longimicrobium sp.]|uniref:hypothetical protein n=1 Tax=Longimicrobium sp. TaxID=2029185 RepID=UPI002E37BCAD|nr:hypothetical protein [Longimicrobium sp.]HEX6038867.1 hypothetical protein [Longimicrobium sp.]
MTKRIAVAVLVLLAGSQVYAQSHDCRAKSLSFNLANLADGSVRLTAVYRAKSDNAALSPTMCPDAIPPTWGAPAAVSYFEDYPSGFRAVFTPGTIEDGVHEFSLIGQQGWAEPVLLYGSTCVRFNGGYASFTACPAPSFAKAASLTVYSRARPIAYSR